MRIFIDESGNFIVGGGVNRACCVSALVVPETVEPTLTADFLERRALWTTQTEVKGSALTDDQMSDLLSLLQRHDVVAIATVFDVGYQSVKDLEAFRLGQADAFVGGLNAQHHPNIHKALREWRADWLKLSLQLMAQMYTLLLTVADVINLVPNYYAQRLPDTLARFAWVIDPKEVAATRFEKLWERSVCP